MYDDPMKVPAASVSSTALDVSSGSTLADERAFRR
jgi:hypothetical protein